ncbi:unnamed protein product, partial [Vitis vinifera]
MVNEGPYPCQKRRYLCRWRLITTVIYPFELPKVI